MLLYSIALLFTTYIIKFTNRVFPYNNSVKVHTEKLFYRLNITIVTIVSVMSDKLHIGTNNYNNKLHAVIFDP